MFPPTVQHLHEENMQTPHPKRISCREAGQWTNDNVPPILNIQVTTNLFRTSTNVDVICLRTLKFKQIILYSNK